MKKKPLDLSIRQMAAARLVVGTNKTTIGIAQELGITDRTLNRWMLKPDFIAYQNQVRAEQDKKMEKKTSEALEKLNFDKPAGIKKLVEIIEADGVPPTAAAQIRALELLGTWLGWAPASSIDEKLEGAPEPDVYQAAWMRKAQ